MKKFRTSELARELGVSADWLRKAERKGKIPMARRDLNNWRIYTKQDAARIGELLLPRRVKDIAPLGLERSRRPMFTKEIGDEVQQI